MKQKKNQYLGSFIFYIKLLKEWCLTLKKADVVKIDIHVSREETEKNFLK